MSIQSRISVVHSASLSACVLAAAFLAGTASAQVNPLGTDPAAVRASFLDAHQGAGIFDDPQGMGISRVYGEAFSHGANPVDSAEGFLKSYAGMFGTSLSQLMPVGPNGDGTHVLPLGYEPADESFRFSLVGYTQHVNGIPVFRGDVRLLVRNEPGYPLVLVSNALKDVRAFASTFTGKAVPPSKIDVNKVSRRALNQFGPGAVVSEAEQVIWAGYDDAPAAEVKLAYKFIVTGTAVFDRETAQRMLYVVDAANGRILFQEDQIVYGDVTVNVKGNATQGTAADACNPEALTAMPYARVTVGATSYFANAQGVVVIPNAANATLSINSNLSTAGQRFNLQNVAGSTSSVTVSASGGSIDIVHNAANTVQADRAQVNGYVQANVVRDYLLTYNPTFPTIAGQTGFPVKVMVSGTCNAFYDGTAINFYPSGGGCNNTAFGPVIHHEYGHHIVNRAGSGQGAYGEGFGDVMGVLVTDESLLGVGFQTCSTGIRNANNTVQYSATGCSSAGSEIHACGTLLSGCVWSVRSNLAATKPATYRSLISNLAIDSVLLHSGTAINGQITIDFLTLDDNDANIGNGTPNYTEINSGFTAHGLPGPALSLLTISFPSGLPATVNALTGATFPVSVTGVTGTPQPGTGRIYYRTGSTGAFTSALMTQTSPNQYLATIPGTACGPSVQYYVSAQTTGGTTVYYPTSAPGTPSAAACVRIGDINGDNVVDGIDLATVLDNWGRPGLADLDGDGTTNASDLALVLSNWG